MLRTVVPWVVRVFLGITFLAGGLPKLLGQPWHRVSQEPWIIPFFEAPSSSGIYWNFLGFCQMLAGALIVLPRTTTLGAVAYFPVLLNVFMIAVSLPFNSGVIGFTGAMLAGNLYLLGLDADKLRPLVSSTQESGVAMNDTILRRTLYGASAFACILIAFHVLIAVTH